MKRTLLGMCFLLSACSSPEKTVEIAKVDHFANMEGCFLLYNMKSEKFEEVIGEKNCQIQYPACSTFKVPLALMAFDSGALKDENVILRWNGKKELREESNRDHDAKTWMSQSIVWFSQRLTPQMGKKKVQKYLNDFDYGNRDLSGGLTKAWLVSPGATTSALKISGYEQVKFMKNLWSDQLPVSKKALDKTKEITFLETSPSGYRLSGKTGSNFFDADRKIHLGWFVSHLQKGEQEYIAVANFRDSGPTEAKGYGGMRVREITKNILMEKGLW